MALTLLALFSLLTVNICDGDQYSEVRMLSAHHYAATHNIQQFLPTNHTGYTVDHILFSWAIPKEQNQTAERALKTTDNIIVPVTNLDNHNNTKKNRFKSQEKEWGPRKNYNQSLASLKHPKKNFNDKSLIKISPVTKQPTRTKQRRKKHRKKINRKKQKNRGHSKITIPIKNNPTIIKVNENTFRANSSEHSESGNTSNNSKHTNYKNNYYFQLQHSINNNLTAKESFSNDSRKKLKQQKQNEENHTTNQTKSTQAKKNNYSFINGADNENHIALHSKKTNSSFLHNKRVLLTNDSTIKNIGMNNNTQQNSLQGNWKRSILLMARRNYSEDDINECMKNNGGCEGLCINLPGSYRCHCPSGFRLDSSRKKCLDVNECVARNGHGPCQGNCVNTWGSYRCNCDQLAGTTLAPDGRMCQDIDECQSAANSFGCSHGCINTIGTAFCFCPDGYILSPDWRTCQNIDVNQNL